MVYATKPQTLEELRDQIIHVINEIPLAAIQTVCRSVRRHCWECTVAEGGHFEHGQLAKWIAANCKQNETGQTLQVHDRLPHPRLYASGINNTWKV